MSVNSAVSMIAHGICATAIANDCVAIQINLSLTHIQAGLPNSFHSASNTLICRQVVQSDIFSGTTQRVSVKSLAQTEGGNMWLLRCL
jgi:hypothetical protein